MNSCSELSKGPFVRWVSHGLTSWLAITAHTSSDILPTASHSRDWCAHAWVMLERGTNHVRVGRTMWISFALSFSKKLTSASSTPVIFPRPARFMMVYKPEQVLETVWTRRIPRTLLLFRSVSSIIAPIYRCPLRRLRVYLENHGQYVGESNRRLLFCWHLNNNNGVLDEQRHRTCKDWIYVEDDHLPGTMDAMIGQCLAIEKPR